MASEVAEANFRGANNNIRSLRHGPSSGTTSFPITDGEVLIESEFLELNSQLHYSKTVDILLTDEFVFVKEMRDRRDSEAHVLQYESGKTVTKFHRSDVSIKVCEGCPFTFKARWSKESLLWKTYELCGREEVWPKWLRSFSVEEPRGHHMIPSNSICEIEGDSDSEDGSEDDDGEDVPFPEYTGTLTLSVDRTISMWSMSMLNPSNVRRLAITQHHRPSLSRLLSSNSSDEVEDLYDSLNTGSLYRSNSHPRLSLVKPFRCSSLPNVCDLDNVRVDSDLKNHGCRTRGETSADDSNRALNSSALLQREGEKHEKNLTLATLQQKVENLRAHPSNLNFVRRGKGDDPGWDSLATPRHRRKHSLDVAMTNEANRIPMPSDSGVRLGARSPIFYRKLSQETKITSSAQETKTPETPLSPKKTDLSRIIKQSAKRCDSLPSSSRPDLSHVIHSERGSDSRVARQLTFKDDMAMELSDSNQQPRKDKIKRFWTILYKKRPKLRMQRVDSEDSVKENDDNIRSGEGSSSSNVMDSDTPNGVDIVAGNRRGGFSGNFSSSKDKTSGLAVNKEEHRTGQTPVQSKQGRGNYTYYQSDQIVNSLYIIFSQPSVLKHEGCENKLLDHFKRYPIA